MAGNPPFSGKTDKVHDVDVLRDYELALLPDGSLRQGVAKEELFLERFVRLAKPGGWIVVVLPRGLLCNPRSRHVREYVVRTCRIAKVLDLPAGVFDGTRASASVLFCQKRTEANATPPPNETTSLLEARRNGDRYYARTVARAETGMLVRRMDSGYHSADAANLRAGLLRLPGARCLGDVTNDIVQGYTKYGRRRRFVQKGGVRYLESRVISPVGILENPRRYVSPRGRMVRASAFVQPADLLVVRVGSACLGRATIVRPRDRGSAINDCIWRLRVDAPAGFIALFLSSKTGRSLVNAAAQQSGGATTLSREFLLEMPVPYVASPMAVAYAEEYERNVLGAGNTDKRARLNELTLRLDRQIARDLRRQQPPCEARGVEAAGLCQ